MPENCLITGAPGLLASHLAALYLLRSDGIVYYTASRCAEARDFHELVRSVCPERDLSSLRWIGRDLSDVRAGRVWHFVGKGGAPIPERLGELKEIGVTEINLVHTPFGGGGASQWLAAESDSGTRVFQTTMTIGRTNPAIGRSREGLLYFLATLFDFKREIEERFPEYFRRRPLRCWAPADASINVIRAEDAADLLLRISGRAPADGSLFHIGGEVETPLSDLLARAGAAYAIDLVGVTDRSSMNSIDALFEHGMGDLLQRREPGGGVASVEISVDLLAEVRRQQEEVRATRDARVSKLPDSLERKTIGEDADALSYCVAGSGDRTIVLLNALAQGLRYWFRLIDYLVARQYRIVVWEIRGTHSPSRPFKLSDQVEDLAAILRNENIQRCSLVGWCTGAKTGIEFCKRYPGIVLSMVLLNSTLKCSGGEKGLDTEYERSLEMFCNVVAAHPDMAPEVLDALLAVIAEKDPDIGTEADPEQLARQVLAMSNRDLRAEILAPFRNPSSLVNYCRQVLDFWSHDVAADAHDIDLPVLIVASELDRVVSVAGSERAAGLFRNASYRQIPGATHYSLYDLPDAIGELIDNFAAERFVGN